MFVRYYFEIQKIDEGDLIDSCPTIRRAQVRIRAARRDRRIPQASPKQRKQDLLHTQYTLYVYIFENNNGYNS